MVSVTEYKCTNCGLKFYDDGRCFYYDEELNQTVNREKAKKAKEERKSLDNAW